jgi:hypothetical protein
MIHRILFRKSDLPLQELTDANDIDQLSSAELERVGRDHFGYQQKAPYDLDSYEDFPTLEQRITRNWKHGRFPTAVSSDSVLKTDNSVSSAYELSDEEECNAAPSLCQSAIDWYLLPGPTLWKQYAEFVRLFAPSLAEQVLFANFVKFTTLSKETFVWSTTDQLREVNFLRKAYRNSGYFTDAIFEAASELSLRRDLVADCIQMALCSLPERKNPPEYTE